MSGSRKKVGVGIGTGCPSREYLKHIDMRHDLLKLLPPANLCRYNVTPSAAYQYAPAYKRYGHKISAVHFIGSNKPWSNILFRPAGISNVKGKEASFDCKQLSQTLLICVTKADQKTLPFLTDGTLYTISISALPLHTPRTLQLVSLSQRLFRCGINRQISVEYPSNHKIGWIWKL